ncbi:unnamed protein product [Pocillopora meandrina]|uniref:Uncharacterized protein n=1 Tax=Pocillopora meandrina TaxID=46732 RepID=A0AAU9VWT2_9CNID|nr:unnamed protein product [Pocillopora meandrina]
MFPEHITVFIFVGLSFAQALGQNSTVVKPSPTASYTMAPMSSQAAQPTTKVPTHITPTQSTTEKETTIPTTETKPTCAMINFVADRMWNASLGNSTSKESKALEDMTSMAMEYLYNDSEKYYNVKVSEVKFVEKDGKVGVEAKLCLGVKKNGGLIEEVFTDKLKTGFFHDLKVMSEGAEFKPKGVDFKDCKAKKGECEKCSGAGGKITIEGTCVPEEYSCDGLKVEKMAKDCVEYCGTVGITVSLLVLAFGMLLSFSSQ